MKHVITGILVCVLLAITIGLIEYKEKVTGTYGLFSHDVIEKSL